MAYFLVVKANNSNNGNTQNNNDSANVSRLATSSNDESNSDENNSVSNHSVDDVNNRIENVLSNPNIKGASSSEEELASYSTNLGSSTENRLTNIRITCGKLNETIVENGETFFLFVIKQDLQLQRKATKRLLFFKMARKFRL